MNSLKRFRNYFVAGLFSMAVSHGSILLANDSTLINVSATTGNLITILDSCTDANDNFYVTGQFNGTIDFGGGDVADLNTGSGSSIFIAKYASSGALSWVKVIGSTKYQSSVSDSGRAIRVDSSGNVYVVGSYLVGTDGFLDLDPGSGTHNVSGTATISGGVVTTAQDNSYLIKLDSSGNFQWAATLVTDSNASTATGVTVDSSSVYFTGSYRMTSPNIGDGTLTDGLGNTSLVPADLAKTVYVAKFNSSTGALIWAKYGVNSSSGDPSPGGIATDTLGNVYAVGGFYDITFGTDALTSGNASGQDGYIWKLSSSGAHVWAKKIGGTDANDQITAVKTDSSDNVYIAGSFKSSNTDLDPGSGTTSFNSAGNSDIFLVKLNSSGDLQWSYTAGSTTQDDGTRLLLDGSGNIYLQGNFTGTVDFDNTSGTESRTAPGTVFDSFVVKLAVSNGAFLWSRNLGGSGADTAAGISVLSNGNIKVCVLIRGTTDVDPSSGTLNASGGTPNAGFAAVTWTSAGFLPSSNVAPTFVGSTTTLSVNQNTSATDIKGLLHASDSDSGQTITWSQSSAPSNGTLTISSATASSGSTDITPGGTITYQPSNGYTGSDSFTVQISDGTGTATRTINVTVNAADTTAPTIVSIARKTPSQQTVGTSSVVFTVTFSEAVQNVSTSSFTVSPVNGSSIAGTVSSVSGGPTVYDITVDITSGRGEFRLDVPSP